MHSRKTTLKAKSKRHFSLLEVLIAFFLIAMCALPLIYPHAFIYKQTKEFAEEVDLDRTAGLIYTAVVERLYRNDFDWAQIEDNTPFEMDEDFLQRAGIDAPFNWEGQYWFEIVKQKSNTNKTNPTKDKNITTVNLVATHLDFKRKNQNNIFEYTYEAVLRRSSLNEAADANEEGTNPKEQPK